MALNALFDKFDDSKRAVAKLMARENITVQVVDGAHTASFDTVSRVLTVPNWSSMTLDQADLLIAHEVGHALFTDPSYIETLVQNPKMRGLMSYFNVVEDARIERKMRNAFPGLTRIFYNGYEHFHTNGPILKGTRTHVIKRDGSTEPIAKMRLIDRINIYFKTGMFSDVPFTAAERVYLDRIRKCSSMQEALQIAKELHARAKENDPPPPPAPPKDKSKKDKKKQGKQDADPSDEEQQDGDESADGDESEDGTESDEDGDSKGDADGDEADDDEDKDAAGSKDADGDESDDESDESDDDDTDGDGADGDDDESDEDASESSAGDGAGHYDRPDDADPMSQTEREAAEALAKVAKEDAGNTQIRHLLYPVYSDADVMSRVTKAVDTASDVSLSLPHRLNGELDKVESEWKEEYGSTVSAMVLDFERRKTAKAQLKATVAKTGRLNVNKLYSYKFSDDLFLRSMNVPNGKSHGIVCLIDGSSSMSGIMANVIDQTLLFAHFAYQAGIPFEAYMFTDKTRGKYDFKTGLNVIRPRHNCTLIGLVNTVSDRASFRKQARALLAMKIGLGGKARSVSYELRNACRQLSQINLHGTPLVSALMLSERLVARMKKNLRLDKMVHVVLSDGQDGGRAEYDVNEVNRGTGRLGVTTNTLGDLPFVVRDAVTKKNIVCAESKTDYRGTHPVDMHNAALVLMNEIITSRNECRTIWMHLEDMTAVRKGTGYGSATSVISYVSREAEPKLNYTELTNRINEDGQFVVPNGVADLTLIINTPDLELRENNFERLDATRLTQKAVAAAFNTAMTKRVSNRKFVNTVVPFIA